MKLLEKRRIIFAIIISAAVIAGGFWFFGKSDKQTITSADIQSAISKNKPEHDTLDSDEDGLKDWEETLWGTDPFNSDTDGDGTPDAEEIKLGRNPLVAGPDDLLTQAPLKSSNQVTGPSGIETEQTLISRVAKEAFQNYIKQVNAGGDDPVVQQQIATYLASNLQSELSASNPLTDDFSEKDVKINSDNSKEAIKNYINTIARITTEEAKSTSGNELILLTRLIENANAKRSREEFEEFGNYVTAYNNSLIKMLSLGAPENYTSDHASLINVLNNMIKINKSFIGFMKDPIEGMQYVGLYANEAGKLKRTLANTQSLLSEDGVDLSPEDEAYILFQ